MQCFVSRKLDSLFTQGGFPGSSVSKESACNRPRFNSWVGKILWRREWQPTPVFLPREFHGQRSLAGYSSWVCKESDTTEWLTLSFSPNWKTMEKVGFQKSFEGSWKEVQAMLGRGVKSSSWVNPLQIRNSMSTPGSSASQFPSTLYLDHLVGIPPPWVQWHILLSGSSAALCNQRLKQQSLWGQADPKCGNHQSVSITLSL